jgi:hypothetical protein
MLLDHARGCAGADHHGQAGQLCCSDSPSAGASQRGAPAGTHLQCGATIAWNKPTNLLGSGSAEWGGSDRPLQPSGSFVPSVESPTCSARVVTSSPLSSTTPPCRTASPPGGWWRGCRRPDPSHHSTPQRVLHTPTAARGHGCDKADLVSIFDGRMRLLRPNNSFKPNATAWRRLNSGVSQRRRPL